MKTQHLRIKHHAHACAETPITLIELATNATNTTHGGGGGGIKVSEANQRPATTPARTPTHRDVPLVSLGKGGTYIDIL